MSRLLHLLRRLARALRQPPPTREEIARERFTDWGPVEIVSKLKLRWRSVRGRWGTYRGRN
jgi:hypothetical protein